MSEINLYRTLNIGKAAFLLLRNHNLAKSERDGKKFIFCFYPDAAEDAKAYEHDAECSAKQY